MIMTQKMTHWKNARQKPIHHCPDAGRCVLPAEGGFFFDYEYAYFWAYFFVSSHAERRVDT